MSRIDNQLLASCERVQKRTTVYAFACMVAVGVAWFLCVAIPAGAL